VNPFTPAVTALGLKAVIEGTGLESRDSYECFPAFGMGLLRRATTFVCRIIFGRDLVFAIGLRYRNGIFTCEPSAATKGLLRM
jgi:hypothetical protein